MAGPGYVWVNPMTLFHTAGCALFTLGPVQGRFTQVLAPGFDPGLVLHLIESERGTALAGVPTMLVAQLDHPDFPGRDLSQVRSAFAGGATVPPALVRRIESAAGVPLSIQYGQTEASCITQTRPGDSPADRAETLGRPHPQVEVQITDPATGETLPAGSVGEILTRGYHVMKGYFADPAATAEAVDTAGWLHTGDLGCMDERGYCRIEGRLKEMIIRGGENIYPREIEQLLHTHPGVADVAVVGVPDDYWGEQVAAFVRPAPGSPVTQDDLASYCRARLAAHKTPRHWVFADAFPLTASGKVPRGPARLPNQALRIGSSAPPIRLEDVATSSRRIGARLPHDQRGLPHSMQRVLAAAAAVAVPDDRQRQQHHGLVRDLARLRGTAGPAVLAVVHGGRRHAHRHLRQGAAGHTSERRRPRLHRHGTDRSPQDPDAHRGLRRHGGPGHHRHGHRPTGTFQERHGVMAW